MATATSMIQGDLYNSTHRESQLLLPASRTCSSNDQPQKVNKQKWKNVFYSTNRKGMLGCTSWRSKVSLKGVSSFIFLLSICVGSIGLSERLFGIPTLLGSY